MKIVGQVHTICSKNSAVITIDGGQLPRLHSEVVDQRKKPVGKLVEVFGNIKTPYALVVCKGPCECNVGDQLFTE
ncbi:RNA-binding protein [Methanogenium marinum]|uniref:RNA-binding protein n=1 Tax=Methanogenium marinum TaxID=348610 RepID=A0A9Q4KVB0_9EURY|nr:RNA-binding protein [Methanogenium marinum]MDE4908091.1 RNA-binding protein [Methanogenium marinum]